MAYRITLVRMVYQLRLRRGARGEVEQQRIVGARDALRGENGAMPVRIFERVPSRCRPAYADARMFAAQTQARVPKLTVTIRKAYGFGSMVMGMIPFDGQSGVFAFPGATMTELTGGRMS